MKWVEVWRAFGLHCTGCQTWRWEQNLQWQRSDLLSNSVHLLHYTIPLIRNETHGLESRRKQPRSVLRLHWCRRLSLASGSTVAHATNPRRDVLRDAMDYQDSWDMLGQRCRRTGWYWGLHPRGRRSLGKNLRNSNLPQPSNLNLRSTTPMSTPTISPGQISSAALAEMQEFPCIARPKHFWDPTSCGCPGAPTSENYCWISWPFRWHRAGGLRQVQD